MCLMLPTDVMSSTSVCTKHQDSGGHNGMSVWFFVYWERMSVCMYSIYGFVTIVVACAVVAQGFWVSRVVEEVEETELLPSE